MEYQRFYTGKNPFGCNQHGETFSYKSTFNRQHHGFHTEQKPNGCFDCGQLFFFNANQSQCGCLLFVTESDASRKQKNLFKSR